ncbi:endo-1,3-alpha-glucanase family glycosylhydrolase [Streptomyces chilikensis]|uniref:Endo-1,3-alpha-glucanase family glycosylhydrolase n=1 Tax=Streptomyces chilikensis TaxID=1194079 RepID=A0ABV3EL24_9ACTN
MRNRTAPRHAAPGRGRRRAGLAALVGVLLLTFAAGTGRGSTDAEDDRAAPSAARDPLPFDLPSTERLRASDRLVFAHYFTPYPLSLDNRPADEDYYARNYLTADGEDGKHAEYGGLLRDRPLPVAPEGGDWRSAHHRQEVRTAVAAGIDGFSVDLLSLEGPHWERVRTLTRAAQEVDPGFRVMLMPDMKSLDAGPAALARALAELGASPNAHRLDDGRLVVSPFKAEEKAPGWWRQVLDILRTRHDTRTAFVPVLLDLTSHAEAFAPLSHGFSAWGSRSHTTLGHYSEHAELARRHGKLWMQPVAVQDARPSQGVYDEAGNTATLRGSWHHAIEDGADWVQLTTWNDYSESTQFAPSLHNGHTYLDLSSYYLTRFKTGSWPRVVRDTVYLTHRVQPHAAPAGLPRPMRLRPGSAPARDTVEVLTFLTAPGAVDVTVGDLHERYTVRGGVRAELLPLRPGRTTAEVTRGRATVAEAATRFAVSAAPRVQDLQYYGVTGGRPADRP